MVFRPEQLLNREAMKEGPFDVFWNQDEWIEPTDEKVLPVGDQWPKRKLLQRLLRHKRWHIVMRIAPPPDTDLQEWGEALAERLKIDWIGPAKSTDRAVWMPMTTWARNAGGAIASAGYVLNSLEGFMLGQAAIRVWKER
jgi:hypothetical protein